MERELIRWIQARCQLHRQVELGIGDDAALIQFSEHQRCVVTTDLLSDGVHFQLGEIDTRRAGRKALAVNLSDLAAMAARPVAATISLVLPRAGGMPLAKELYEGIFDLARQFEISIAGGDTNSWDGPLAISVTALGETTSRGCWRRDGAQPGDHILVTGPLGGSLAGKHLDFIPRVHEALWIHERFHVNAATDISDGLSRDLSNIAQASGCGAVIDPARVPIADAAFQLGSRSSSPLEHALHDGEDFELILIAPSLEAEKMLADQPSGVTLQSVGHMIEAEGLWLQEDHGTLQPLVPRGYEHPLHHGD